MPDISSALRSIAGSMRFRKQREYEEAVNFQRRTLPYSCACAIIKAGISLPEADLERKGER